MRLFGCAIRVTSHSPVIYTCPKLKVRMSLFFPKISTLFHGFSLNISRKNYYKSLKSSLNIHSTYVCMSYKLQFIYAACRNRNDHNSLNFQSRIHTDGFLISKLRTQYDPICNNYMDKGTTNFSKSNR